MLEITTDNYSGPLGLLLQLTEKEELDITEINLAKIADQYIQRIREVANIEAEELADFLVIASKLLYIKSKAILPYLQLDDDEEDLDDLQRQLKMYKEFVEASKKIKERLAENHFMFTPLLNKSRRSQFKLPKFVEPKNVSQEELRDAFSAVVDRIQKDLDKDKLPEKTLEPKVSIDDKIGDIKGLLAKRIKVSFSKFIAQAKSTTEVVVSFLAVLELAKQQELVFEQGELFSEIHIKYKE